MIADIYYIPAKAEALPHEGGIGPCGPICLRKRALRNVPFWTTCCASSANAVPACQPICLSACQCGCASVRRVTHEPSLTVVCSLVRLYIHASCNIQTQLDTWRVWLGRCNINSGAVPTGNLAHKASHGGL